MALTPVELDWPQASPGLTAASRALPSGWQRGISFLALDCTSPVVMGECPTGDNLKPAQRGDEVSFVPVDLITALACTSLDNNTNWQDLAGAELDRVRDFALEFELLTATASIRDAGTNDPNPGLVNTAVDLGATATTLAAALGCLERAILEANSGRGAVLFMPVEVAWAAADAGILYRDGAQWRTPLGNKVLVSAAYDGRAPVDSGSGTAPAPGAELYVYGTTAVFAGIGERSSLFDVNRAVNTTTARAEDIALAAFSPCATFAVGTPVTACDTEGA